MIVVVRVIRPYRDENNNTVFTWIYVASVAHGGDEFMTEWTATVLLLMVPFLLFSLFLFHTLCPFISLSLSVTYTRTMHACHTTTSEDVCLVIIIIARHITRTRVSNCNLLFSRSKRAFL